MATQSAPSSSMQNTVRAGRAPTGMSNSRRRPGTGRRCRGRRVEGVDAPGHRVGEVQRPGRPRSRPSRCRWSALSAWAADRAVPVESHELPAAAGRRRRSWSRRRSVPRSLHFPSFIRMAGVVRVDRATSVWSAPVRIPRTRSRPAVAATSPPAARGTRAPTVAVHRDRSRSEPVPGSKAVDGAARDVGPPPGPLRGSSQSGPSPKVAVGASASSACSSWMATSDAQGRE